MRDRWWIGVAAGLAIGLGAAAGVSEVSGPAVAQQSAEEAGFALTPAQLRINQRISQAAVRRANEGLELLGPLRPPAQADAPRGWRAADLRDGAVTSAKVADGAVTGPKLADGVVGPDKLAPALRGEHEQALARLPMFAVVAAGTGGLVRAQGATGSAKLAAPGLYAVVFPRDVGRCAYTPAVAGEGTEAPPPGHVSAWTSSDNANVVVVRTADVAGADTNAVPFHLTVTCPPPAP